MTSEVPMRLGVSNEYSANPWYMEPFAGQRRLACGSCALDVPFAGPSAQGQRGELVGQGSQGGGGGVALPPDQAEAVAAQALARQGLEEAPGLEVVGHEVAR